MRPHEMAEAVLDASRADATMVVTTSSSTVHTRWARNELTTNGHTAGCEVTIIAVHHGPGGPQIASVTRPAAGLDVQDFAAQALARARSGTPAWDAQPLPRTSSAPDGPWSGPAAEVAADDLRTTLAGLGAQMACDADAGREHFGYLEVERSSCWLATSEGLRLRYDRPAARLELTVKSHQRTRSTWQGFAGDDLADADVDAMARSARTELDWQSRTVDVPVGRHPAVLRPSAVADLMIDMLWGADARAAADGRSVFSAPGGGTRLGAVLSTRPLRLFSDPRLAGLPGAPFHVATMSHDAASVFDNGLALEPTSWIEGGRLHALVSSRASAQAAGVPVALAPDNLAMDAAGSGGVDDLIGRVDDGLLVTCTWYNRMVDPNTHLITGLTRDGVYLVRGGEVVGSAGNFRFNESPVDLLNRITDASAAVPALGREMADYFPRTRMPALAVADFNFSSASEAV